MKDVYAIPADGPNYINSEPLGFVRNRTYDGEHPRNAREFLTNGDEGNFTRSDHFELVVRADELDDILGGTADEAIEAVESGDYDDILDALKWAEEQHDARVTVLEAIEDRAQYIGKSEG